MSISKRRLVLVGAGIAALVFAGSFTGGALAGGGFSDVPPGHAFEDEITWMADTGISTGYPDGTFRPGQAVTRQAMAAFMGRLADSFYVVTAVVNPPDGLFVSGSAECIEGDRPLAGGGSTASAGWAMQDSRPDEDGWRVAWESIDGTEGAPTFIEVFALCGPPLAEQAVG
jgi:hypothetical protein